MANAPLVDDNYAIEIKNVNKAFDAHKALIDVNLNVRVGEVVVIIGPSGSGKSTLCRCINGLEKIDSGEIDILDKPLPKNGKALEELRAEVGMVFQSFNLFAHKTILENITMAPKTVLKLDDKTANDEAMTLLTRVGVESQAKKHPSQLSGGQQQRVAIARALAMHPKIMLFDEPTSALDPEMINEVLDIMTDLGSADKRISLQDFPMTLVVVTHEMGFARRAADRIIFMADGKIVEEATPDEFFTNPKSDRAKEFLSKILSH